MKAILTDFPNISREEVEMGREIAGRRQRRLVPAALLLLVLVLGSGWRFGWLRPGLRAGQIQSIAVLPLANLSGDPQQEYVADGVTEELTTDLAIRELERTVELTGNTESQAWLGYVYASAGERSKSLQILSS